jgi:hypothetical protein
MKNQTLSTWFLHRMLLLTFVTGLPSALAAPPVQRSVHYDGTSANVQTYAYHPLMNTNVEMTIEAWVYREDSTRCETILSHDFRSSFWLGFCDRLRFYRSGGSATATQPVPSNQWTHVAASYDGTRVRFYINGNAAGDFALANSGVGPANQLHIGGVPETDSGFIPNGYYYRGNIDELRLWHTARTQSQIQSNMFVELYSSGTNGTPGLTACWALGGGPEPFRGWSGSAALAPSRISGFGILPSHLVIPRAAAFNFNGDPDPNFEFAGAEQMVLRYNDGANARDAVVYMVYRNTGTDRYLYFGAKDLRAPIGRTWEESSLSIYVDPNGSREPTRQNGDFVISTTTGGGSGSGFIFQAPFFQIYPQGVSNWQYMVSFCRGEFEPPCHEVRIHRSDIGSFANSIGLALFHGPNTNSTDIAAAPGNANSLSPITYARAVFGGDAASGLATVTVTGRVINAFSGAGLSNHIVRLYSGNDSLTGTFVAQSITSSGGGWAFNNSPIIGGEAITVTLERRTDFSYAGVEWGPDIGPEPVGTNHASEVVYAACDGCTNRPINFRLMPPPGAMRLDAFSPSNGFRSVTVRTSPPPRIHRGTEVTLVGSNIHDRIQVFFSLCDVFPPDFCHPSDIFEAQIEEHDPNRMWVTVRVPEVLVGRLYRLIVRDNWIGHPGWTEWKYMPEAAGRFLAMEQPYPFVWGFDFYNDGDGPGIEDFEAAYGQNIFTFIPVPPFKVRDPYYYTFWAPLYYIAGAAASDGNCHGMAAVSRMFQNGTLRVSDWDNLGSGGPAGVRFPNGFPGQITTNGPGPFKPARWTGFDFFEPFRPRNLWALIRQNMMAQFSEEGIQNILNQTTFDGGNPVAVLNRVRSNPAGYVLCFQAAGAINGHCVTPYAVEDGLRLNDSMWGTTNSSAADFSIIRLYDNNFPNQERHLEINRSANQFTYRLGTREGEPVVWSGRSLYTVPMSFFTSGRHAPGPWILAMPDRLLRLIFAGGADAQHMNSSGDVWGWDAAGNFQQNYRGSKSFFPFALGDYSNRVTRTGFAFLPATNPPTMSRVNVRGSNYIFHAAMDNTAVQFVAEQTMAGTAEVQVVLSNSTLAGFSLDSAVPIVRGSPMLAQPNAGGGSTVYIIIGLSLPAANPIDVITTEVIGEMGRQGNKGIRLVNRGGAPLNFSLNMQSADGGEGVSYNRTYGPFNVPMQAASDFLFPMWPQANEVRAQMDFGNDGSIDQVSYVAADYLIFANRSGNELTLRWRSPKQDDLLQATDNLADPKWGNLNVTPMIDGDWKTVKLPTAGPERYFRVRQR